MLIFQEQVQTKRSGKKRDLGESLERKLARNKRTVEAVTIPRSLEE